MLFGSFSSSVVKMVFQEINFSVSTFAAHQWLLIIAGIFFPSLIDLWLQVQNLFYSQADYEVGTIVDVNSPVYSANVSSTFCV